jgi:ubiquinone/menaquinone biosynthesis C-methylase UbiE
VRELYEDVWEQLPRELDPFDPDTRRRFLLEHVSPGERVLDIGCGEADFAACAAAAGAQVIGADIAEAALARARERHPDIDLRRVEPHGPLPFEDCEFDLVWASEVIEHVADTQRWLSEVRRVLAPGGELVITTPFHGRVKNALIALTRFERHHDPVGQHLRFYTRRSLRDLLLDFGFEPLTIRTAGGPPLLRRTLLASARRARAAGAA